MLDAPIPQDRDLELNFTSYLCTATINIVGASLQQVRVLSEELFNSFDANVNVDGFPNIEDVSCSYPEESISFDSQTSQTNFETSQSIQFYFVK